MSYSENNCLHYWDLCSAIPIKTAVALWCDVEPSELESFNFSTSCMDVKQALIEQALLDKKLDYHRSSTAHGLANLNELIEKDQLRITKDSLRRWFLDMPTGDRPAFLFDESRIDDIPDGGEVAEMNTDRALVAMALLLSNHSKKYKTGDRANASAISNDVLPLAQKLFGDDVKLVSFNKRLGRALNRFKDEIDLFDF